MWPASLLFSIALHAAVLIAVGVKGGSSAEVSARPFSLIDLPSAAVALVPLSNEAVQGNVAIRAQTPKASPRPESGRPGAILSEMNDLSFERQEPTFYKSSEVSHLAQMQFPLEGALFTEELALSGRLVLDISISEYGKVVNIEVVEASDVSGALRAHMLPLLKNAPYTPAYKEGRPVNSIRRVEFVLGLVSEDPTLGFNAAVSPGFRPRMDERGNILRNQPKP
jgi:outer membrane biosynthesis protein TonB